MKFKVAFVRVALLLPFLFMLGCASMKESVKARKMLEKCGYELTEIQLDLIDFNSTISFNNSSKKINVDDPGKDVMSMLKEIKNGDFSVDLSKLRFNAVIKITNPNDMAVELDSLILRAFLDVTYLMDVKHLEHTSVSPKSSQLTNVAIALPTDFPFRSILEAKDLVLKGKIWLNLKTSQKTNITLPLPVSFRKEIPRDKINQAMADEKDKKIGELVDYISSQGKDKFMKAIKSKF